MNPQENQPVEYTPAPFGRQLILIAIVAIAVVGVVIFVRGRSKSEEAKAGNNDLNPNQVLMTKAAEAAVELKTAAVRMEPAAREIKANGVIHFSPYSTINVSPRLTGKVTSVFVKVGDHVTSGETIAVMASPDAASAVDTLRDNMQQLQLTTTLLATARQQFKMGTPEITAAEATEIAARENVNYTKRMLDLTREQSGIGGFSDKPLTDAQSAVKQAETQLSQDQKDLALAQKQYDRTSKLFGYGVAAKADVETAEDTLGKAKDAVSNDNEQLRIARITVQREEKAYKTRLYSNQNVQQAETNYQQAVIQERSAATAVRMVKASLLHDLKQAEHDYEAAKADYHSAQTAVSIYDNPTAEGAVTVKAPAAGVITARNINPGQMVDQTGETPWQMFTIVSANVVYLDTQIFEKDMVGIHVGQHVTATSDAMPSGTSFSGTISYVSPGLDPNTHALSVRADMDNTSGLLKDGLYLNASIEVGPHAGFRPLPIVPLTAVVHDGNSDYVFLARTNGKYDRQEVTLGEQRGESDVVITKGLSGNETIVTHGALYLGTGGTADN